MAHLLDVDSSTLSTDSVSEEIETTFRKSWQELASQERPPAVTQADYQGQAQAEESSRRPSPAHRSGRISRGPHAPGLHRRQQDPGKAVAQLAKVLKFRAL